MEPDPRISSGPAVTRGVPHQQAGHKNAPDQIAAPKKILATREPSTQDVPARRDVAGIHLNIGIYFACLRSHPGPRLWLKAGMRSTSGCLKSLGGGTGGNLPKKNCAGKFSESSGRILEAAGKPIREFSNNMRGRCSARGRLHLLSVHHNVPCRNRLRPIVDSESV